MNPVKGMIYLAFTCIILSCKKTPVEPEKIQGRDTSIKTAETVLITAVNGLPTIGLDSIYGAFICCRPIGASPNGNYIYNAQPGFYLSKLPQPSLEAICNYSLHSYQSYAYNDQKDSSMIIIEFVYLARTYKLRQRGFPTLILQTKFRDNYTTSAYPNFPYRIEFNKPEKNTDVLRSCNGLSIPLTDSLVLLKTCSNPVYPGKPSRFSIAARNYSHFRINGKLFIIENMIEHSYLAY